jgi:hypothetical protein
MSAAPTATSSPMPAPAGPAPGIPVYSRVDQFTAALAGKACTYFDMIGLKSFAATITSVTPNKQIVINSPNGGGSMTFPLTPMDGALLLPIGILN